MAPFPTKVSQVRIYPYIPNSLIVVPAVFTGGAGTYSVGTLGRNVFYNLDLTSGEPQHGGVHSGNRYYAICTNPEGSEFTTMWLTCLQGGETPRFGRTITHGRPRPQVRDDADLHEDIAYQIHLNDVSVSAYIPPNEPLSIPLIENGKGIATFAGLLPGGTWSVTVAGGERPNHLQEGMTVTIAGTNVATGKPFHIPAVFETKETGDPAEFVEWRVLREL
ncbi:hypothetical protein [Chromobacterium haemolyticum]|uniref:hypothetical protein n=1 Tax=Chromobacterium TaxID=535 RepID=UPI00193B3223|nr:hypothetical protein JOS77_19420 [Chromobacterium haemolyticum]